MSSRGRSIEIHVNGRYQSRYFDVHSFKWEYTIVGRFMRVIGAKDRTIGFIHCHRMQPVSQTRLIAHIEL